MATQVPQDTVPLQDLAALHREIENELVDVVRQALRSSTFVGGPQVEGFEREFADYCGTADCVGVASGTDAVRLALTAVGVGRGDAVVTVSHTFIATVEAISQTGAETELVDIDERTCCMSPAALDSYLASCAVDPASGRPVGQRTGRPIKAVVPVHLYGQMADMAPIMATAERHGLMVVEDACQAHGAEYRTPDGAWRRAGAFGRAAAFSFYPVKNLGALGDAGAVTTSDPDVARAIRMLREHGQAKKYYHEVEGYNSRLDAIQAGFLRVKLRHLDGWNARRRDAADRYAQHLASVPGLTLPFEPPDRRSVHHLYVVRHPRRDALIEYLKAEDVACGLHYPVPLHLQTCYRAWNYGRSGALRVTERAAAESLSLPMFPSLTEEQQCRVAELIRSYPG